VIVLKKIALLILLTFIVYSNTFDNGFVWDDTKLIAENVKVHYLKYIPQFFTRDYFDRASAPSHSGLAQQYWRPLVLLSFSVDYFFWGQNPLGYHLTSVAFHTLNAILVLMVLGAIPKTRPVAWYASLIFALHPLDTNVVAFISGRTDLLATTFFLLTCVFFLRYISLERSGYPAIPGIALCFSLSLMAKESFLVAPLLLLLLAAYVSPRSKRRVAEALCASLAILAVFFIYRSAADIPLGDWRAALRHVSARTLLAVAESFTLYGRLFLLPIGLHLERFLSVPPRVTPGALSSAFLLVAATLMAVRSFRRRNRNGFFFLWFLLALLPVSNILPIYPGLAATQIHIGEHLLYLPSIGLSGLLASVWLAALNRRTAPSLLIRTAGVSVLIAFGALTYAHNEYWQNELTFYEETVRTSPTSSRILLNLGLSYAQQRRYDEAEKTIARSLALNPNWAIAHNGLGAVYAMKGDADAARREFSRAVELDPMLAAAHYNLGMTAADTAEAVGHYRRAIEVSPTYTAAKIKLASAYMEQGETDKAIEILNNALAYDPRSFEARANLATAFEKASRFKEAAGQYRIIASQYPGCTLAVEKMREMGEKSQIPNPKSQY
jgi:tetratricopeptide (TPR) repeat protein